MRDFDWSLFENDLFGDVNITILDDELTTNEGFVLMEDEKFTGKRCSVSRHESSGDYVDPHGSNKSTRLDSSAAGGVDIGRSTGIVEAVSEVESRTANHVTAEEKMKMKILMKALLKMFNVKNADNATSLHRLVGKYFEKDCEIKLNPHSQGQRGTTFLLEFFDALRSTYPDVVSVFKYAKYHNGVIRAKFVFSGTKTFDTAGEFSWMCDYSHPFHAQLNPELHARAKAILAKGERYVMSGVGRLIVVPNESRDKFIRYEAVISDVTIVEASGKDDDDDDLL